jgi:hypothetical protein
MNYGAKVQGFNSKKRKGTVQKETPQRALNLI